MNVSLPQLIANTARTPYPDLLMRVTSRKRPCVPWRANAHRQNRVHDLSSVHTKNTRPQSLLYPEEPRATDDTVDHSQTSVRPWTLTSSKYTKRRIHAWLSNVRPRPPTTPFQRARITTTYKAAPSPLDFRSDCGLTLPVCIPELHVVVKNKQTQQLLPLVAALAPQSQSAWPRRKKTLRSAKS